MSSAAARALTSVSRAAFSWKPTGRPQQTLAAAVSRSGVGLHSGARVTATLFPTQAGEGRYFLVEGEEEAKVAAEVGNAEPRSQLCTTLRRGEGAHTRVRTVEHLLSAMEALGVDNCRIEVSGGDEIPLLDGSAQEWVEAIQSVGLCAAEDANGLKLDKLAPEIHEPVYLGKDDCFIAAFPSSQIHITYGIDFPKVPTIGCQWVSTFLDENIYSSKIAPARTFCIFEEVSSRWVGPGPWQCCQQHLPPHVDLDHPCVLVPAMAPADLEADDVRVVQANDGGLQVHVWETLISRHRPELLTVRGSSSKAPSSVALGTKICLFSRPSGPGVLKSIARPLNCR
ncbi:hypothetical protein SORBI_3001G451100 [Sorghum bicolor]|uniref:UDP-3-O-acyl-N-acetylglucosamine deacetylase n=1 Tax=Sorghum bicolor TaxID=4558 RepID=A0A1Z5SAZ1_SORBI|nr:hypothetical protein SORBI_3001G451100 [Sorghum bicolor]